MPVFPKNDTKDEDILECRAILDTKGYDYFYAHLMHVMSKFIESALGLLNKMDEIALVKPTIAEKIVNAIHSDIGIFVRFGFRQELLHMTEYVIRMRHLNDWGCFAEDNILEMFKEMADHPREFTKGETTSQETNVERRTKRSCLPCC